ncbi:MAG: indole-3-glycerol phosphate synthase TrpC [Syntrophobacteria bacterium]
MILDDIVAHKRKEVAQFKERVVLSELEKAAALAPEPCDFFRAVGHGGRPAIIAEIKRASPSAGMIRERLDVASTAAIYEKEGAAAVSLVTERAFFKGKLEWLAEVRQAVSLPLLCKDFVVDPVQVLAARAAGADALLLISAILEQDSLVRLLGKARSLGMSCLVEVHDSEELVRALATDARIIGINNRDLRTFEVRLETTYRLCSRIPADRLVVSESGIHERADVKSLGQAGVHGALVGTSLMRARDPGRKLRELLGKPGR